jgi:hypothetical protein
VEPGELVSHLHPSSVSSVLDWERNRAFAALGHVYDASLVLSHLSKC